MMRNLIGLLIAHETIFPINVGHVLGDHRTFETYLQLHKNFTTSGKLCLKNRITDKKSMRYTANSTETDFREQIKILLQRLEIVHQKFELKRIEFDYNGKDYERICKTIYDTVVSCCIADRSKNHVLASTIMKNRKEDIVKEFTIVYGKPMNYVEKKESATVLRKLLNYYQKRSSLSPQLCI